MPGLCHANCPLRARAMSGYGHISWNQARPPLPATSETERAVGFSDAAYASPLPPVFSRMSKILERDTPSAAPAARLHLINARRDIWCCSSRSLVLDFAMG